MTYSNELCTLDDLRKSGEGSQLNISGNTADPFLLQLIREVSTAIEDVSNRRFSPYLDTQHYDSPSLDAWSAGLGFYSGGRAGDEFQSRTGGYGASRRLAIDTDDLLEVVSLINGDGTVITTGNYLLYPANSYPKSEIRLKRSSGLAWQPDSQGNSEQVVALSGIFGFHSDYTGSAWGGGGTLAAQIGTTTATAFALSAGSGVEAGHLLKIESEYLYVSGLAGTTATVERAVNGSAAAVHTTGTAVSYWRPVFTAQKIARMAAAAHWNLRANPEGKQVSINGVTFTTPNSITEWISNEMDQSGLTHIVGLG